jgi:hypothetical protein
LHRPPSVLSIDSLSESDSLSRAWFPEIVPLGLAATKTMQQVRQTTPGASDFGMVNLFLNYKSV